MQIDYTWNLDNTVATRTETNNVTSENAVVTFAYDNRARLIGESRIVNSSQTVYDLTYTYDQLGNRKQKLDTVGAGHKTVYTYDTDFTTQNFPDPSYVTRNNRLLWYVDSIGDGQNNWTPMRTVKYTYYVTGDASNITIKDEWTGQGEAPAEYGYYYDLALYYTEHHKLWRALWDKWTLDGYGQPTDYTKLSAREFYYDSGRQRYLDRDVDPDTWQQIGAGRWTDYLGARPYADFTHSGGYPEDPTEQTACFGGHAQQTVSTADTAYRHADLIGSTMLTTDDSASGLATLSYTAFGEPIGDASALGTRYQYGGGWGYESGLLTLQGPNTELPPTTLQHVGARWYDPALGRFIQRDGAGPAGGLNLYLYCDADPVAAIDPCGLWPWGVAEAGAIYRGAREGGKSVKEATEEVKRWMQISASIEIPGVILCGFGAGAGASNGVVRVSMWGGTLRPGRWVMLGGATIWNYILSGKWQYGCGNQYAPFSSGQEFLLDAEDVCLPNLLNPINWIKAIIRQREYWP